MGAWGPSAFENDSACDWAHWLEGLTDLSLVETALAAIDLVEGATDVDLACEALAACEVIARLLGNAGTRDAYTKPIDDWVEAHPQRVPAALLATALEVLDAIEGSGSELAELWDGDESWTEAMDELRQRLTE